MTAHAEALDAWLAAMPDLVAHLEATTHPRIAEVGCGQGDRALDVARAFPHAWVDGFDEAAEPLADARHRAAQEGLDGRVRFVSGGADRLVDEGLYDLVLLVTGRTAGVRELSDVRGAVRRGGSVLVAHGPAVIDRATRAGYARVDRVPGARGLYRLHSES